MKVSFLIKKKRDLEKKICQQKISKTKKVKALQKNIIIIKNIRKFSKRNTITEKLSCLCEKKTF